MKCNNGKWKYGKRGKCVFDTLEHCKAAEAAIYARENEKNKKDTLSKDDKQDLDN